MRLLLLVWMLLCAGFLASITFDVDEIRVEASADDSTAAWQLAHHLAQDAVAVQRKLGVYPSYPLTLVVASDNAQYQDLVKSAAPIIEFSEAAYQFSSRRMIVRNPRDVKQYSRLRSIVLHEYIHSLVHYLWADAPLWFHEGMAVYFSGGLTSRRELNFMSNYAAGNYLPLQQMTKNYPESQLAWESLYAYSALAVKYLATRHKKRWFAFFARGASGESFYTSFRQSFYFTAQGFSHQFEAYAQSHFRMGMIFAVSALLWACIPLILVIGAIRRKFIARRILLRWQREEEKESERI